MQVETAHAPARFRHEGATIYFRSDHCRARFIESPARFLGDAPAPAMAGDETPVDPVCGMSISPESAAATKTHEGVRYFFCTTSCAERFALDPRRFVEGGPESMTEPTSVMVDLTRRPTKLTTALDPVCTMSVEVNAEALTSQFDAMTYYFCASGCRDRFRADPTSFL